MSRRVPRYDDDDVIAAAQRAYVEGDIEVDELERAVAHVLAGGMGDAQFPYLPVFRAFATETVWA